MKHDVNKSNTEHAKRVDEFPAHFPLDLGSCRRHAYLLCLLHAYLLNPSIQFQNMLPVCVRSA